MLHYVAQLITETTYQFKYWKTSASPSSGLSWRSYLAISIRTSNAQALNCSPASSEVSNRELVCAEDSFSVQVPSTGRYPSRPYSGIG